MLRDLGPIHLKKPSVKVLEPTDQYWHWLLYLLRRAVNCTAFSYQNDSNEEIDEKMAK